MPSFAHTKWLLLPPSCITFGLSNHPPRPLVHQHVLSQKPFVGPGLAIKAWRLPAAREVLERLYTVGGGGGVTPPPLIPLPPF